MTSFLRNLRETLTPIRTSSAFLTSGVLTPEEFVLAGDELVFKCPTWAWEGGDPKHRRKHLPPDKQYLITRNVPCVERANTCEASGYGGSTDEDGWFLESVKKGMAEVSEEDDFECIEEVDRLGENVKSVTVSASEEEGKKSAAVDDDDDFASAFSSSPDASSSSSPTVVVVISSSSTSTITASSLSRTCGNTSSVVDCVAIAFFEQHPPFAAAAVFFLAFFKASSS